MIRIVAIEWIKLRSFKPFWILTGLTALIYLIASWAIAKVSSLQTNIPMPDFLEYPHAWETYAWIGRWMLYFFGFAVIQLVCNEREFRTDRQNIIDGLSRLQYFFAKWFNGLIPAIVTVPLVVLLALQFGSGENPWIGYAGPLARFALCALCYGAFATFLGLVTRKSGTATFLFIAYPIAIEALFGLVVDYYTKADISQFLPFSIINGLIQSPFSEIQTQLGMTFVASNIVLGLAIAYLCVLWGMSLALISRRNF